MLNFFVFALGSSLEPKGKTCRLGIQKLIPELILRATHTQHHPILKWRPQGELNTNRRGGREEYLPIPREQKKTAHDVE